MDEPFEYEGDETLRPAITEALRRVVDPEMALSILDVGLVYRVIESGGVVHVTMTMTSAACPVADVIVDDVHGELLKVLPRSHEVDVEIVWEPPWTPDRMSPRARLFMGW